MSYTPTEWKNGDVITAERLNKAEQGIKDAHDNVADISSEISTEVASWLGEHVNVTEGVNIDDTLSVAGSAADAAKVGEELGDLKSSIGNTDDMPVALPAVQNDHFWNSESTTAVLTSYSGTYCAYDALAVAPGEKYRVSIRVMTSNKQHAILLTNDSLTIIASYGPGTGSQEVEDEFEFTVPANATKMLLTTKENVTPTVTLLGHLNSLPALADRVDEIEDAIGWKGNPDQTIDVTSLKNENNFWNSEGSTAVLTSYNNYCAYNALTVSPGDNYSVSVFRMSSRKQHAILLVDDSLNIINAYGQGTGSTDGREMYSFEIPSGATKLLLTTKNSEAPVVVKLGEGQHLHDVDSVLACLRGKTVAIIGDSISTNGNTGEDPNVPEITVEEEDVGVELSAYLTYYDVQAGLSLGGHVFTSAEIGTEVTFTPTAADVGKSIGLPSNYNPNSTSVWWEIMQEALGNTTIPVCWSGSSVTSHEASSDSYKTAHAWHDAQIRKCGIRIPGTMTRTAPDVIIIYRGTNDFSHSPYALLTNGYFDSYSWQYPSDDAVSGGYGYKEGIALTIKKIRAAYPNAQIWLCTLNVFKRVNYSHFPTNNGTNSLPQYNDAIREVADFFGCGVIDFAKDGITFENCYSGGYITDSDTTPTHPSDKGHAVMGRKAIADIRAKYNEM